MTSKSHCIKLFSEIFSDSASRYRFCCHAGNNDTIEKYTVLNTNPFDYFLSKEMDQVRQDALAGKPIAGCEVCYKEVERYGQSYRTNYNMDYKLAT